MLRLSNVRLCWRFHFWLLLMLLASPDFLHAEENQEAEALYKLYDKSEVMIPVRDGIKLYTEVYRPVDQTENLPILFMRTPYGVKDKDGGFSRYFAKSFRELGKQKYIIALQDARGRHGSEGKFEWNRPVRHRKDPNAVDASTDAYDSIDWMVKNLEKNNGRVGMLGVSYPGWYTTMALIDPHPALKAASPQASPSDYFINDDFYHHGAFRLSPSAELPYLFDFDPKDNAKFPYDQIDTYEFFLDMGPLSKMNERYLKGASPTWDNFMKHATYDEYWEEGNTLQHFKELTVPTLCVVGWWDAENLGGQLDLYEKLESVDKENLCHLVVGPWSHGQWSRGPNDHLGEYDFGSDTVAFYQQDIEARFFAYHLKDEGKADLPEALIFQTGSNQWKQYTSWPPKEASSQGFMLLHDGKLAKSTRSGDLPNGPIASYISDPNKPVPFSKRPILGFWNGLTDTKDPRFERSGILWKVEDQRFVSDRPDVVSFTTEPLEEDVELVGNVSVHLAGSSSGTDCDWVVKLIDVYPESYPEKPEMGGYQLMIADDVLRGKFRNSFKKLEPLVPDKEYDFKINLRTRSHKFRKGHRIMLQVQSSWFPLIDRNPQKFIDIPNASEADFQPATQVLWMGSKIEFQSVERVKESKKD